MQYDAVWLHGVGPCISKELGAPHSFTTLEITHPVTLHHIQEDVNPQTVHSLKRYHI